METAIDAEMRLLETDIADIQDRLVHEKRLMACALNDTDEQIQDYIIITLEQSLVTLREQLEQLSALKEYQSSCEHEFISDLIDIDPDRSKQVVYCKHCHFCK